MRMEAVLILGPGQYKELSLTSEVEYIDIPYPGGWIARFKRTSNPLDTLNGRQIFRMVSNRKISMVENGGAK
jgi:hypothetical protein